MFRTLRGDVRWALVNKIPCHSPPFDAVKGSVVEGAGLIAIGTLGGMAVWTCDIDSMRRMRQFGLVVTEKILLLQRWCISRKACEIPR